MLLFASQQWNYDWAGMAFGDDMVHIASDDPKACTPPCKYYVAVFSVSDSSFTVTATLSEQRVIRLIDGQPQTSNVAQNQYRYFQLTTFGGERNISIHFTTISGQVELYVSSTANEGTQVRPLRSSLHVHSPLLDCGHPACVLCFVQPADALPTRGHHTWSSVNPEEGGLQDGVEFTMAAGADRTLLIGALGVQESSFTITARSEFNAQTLVPGVPSTRHMVNRGEMQYYMVSVPQNPPQDLTVSVTPYSGDPELLITTRYPYRPNCTFDGFVMHCENVIWSSHNSMNKDIIHINANDPCANAEPRANCK